MFVFIKKQKIRNTAIGSTSSLFGFNVYQKVDGQKPNADTQTSGARFNVYQKVEGQKHGYNTALAMAGFNVYQKVDGQKRNLTSLINPPWFNVYQKVEGQEPSISNIETTGDDSKWLNINTQQAFTIKNQNEIKSHNYYVPTIYNKYIIP